MLPNRIVFFPQAAFPIKNGSAILVSVSYELTFQKRIVSNCWIQGEIFVIYYEKKLADSLTLILIYEWNKIKSSTKIKD